MAYIKIHIFVPATKLSYSLHLKVRTFTFLKNKQKIKSNKIKKHKKADIFLMF